MKKNNEFKKIIEKKILECSLNYNLTDVRSINIFTSLVYSALKENEYNPETGLNEEIFIKNIITNTIDRYMIKKIDNKEVYSIIENRLMKLLDIACKQNKKKYELIDKKELDYYKEYAILKAVETYNEDEIDESLNLYTNRWFMAFINKEVTEESEKVLVK